MYYICQGNSYNFAKKSELQCHSDSNTLAYCLSQRKPYVAHAGLHSFIVPIRRFALLPFPSGKEQPEL